MLIRSQLDTEPLFVSQFWDWLKAFVKTAEIHTGYLKVGCRRLRLSLVMKVWIKFRMQSSHLDTILCMLCGRSVGSKKVMEDKTQTSCD